MLELSGLARNYGQVRALDDLSFDVAPGQATLWQVALSALLAVVATIALARVAAIIYERAILRTGRRVKVREVLRART